MKQSLRKTPSRLHLVYKYGEDADRLVGRNFTLDAQQRLLTLGIDLTPNFHTRNKNAANYLDAISFSNNHHKLKSLQCTDNLLRSRLIRAWEQVEHPEMRMCLDLGPRGQFLYAVLPHSLLMGGIQLDVQEVLDEVAPAGAAWPGHHHSTRNHA